jgi:hypothetical protein
MVQSNKNPNSVTGKVYCNGLCYVLVTMYISV